MEINIRLKKNFVTVKESESDDGDNFHKIKIVDNFNDKNHTM